MKNAVRNSDGVIFLLCVRKTDEANRRNSLSWLYSRPKNGHLIIWLNTNFVRNSYKVIVSGHQRVRACRELGINEILAEVRVYDDEDKVIKDLLETNIRQRGNIGGSSIKLGRRIRELEKVYGIKQGNNQHSGLSTNLTQKDLAEKLGINLKTLQRAKTLASLS